MKLINGGHERTVRTLKGVVVKRYNGDPKTKIRGQRGGKGIAKCKDWVAVHLRIIVTNFLHTKKVKNIAKINTKP